MTHFGGRTESAHVSDVACRSFKPITWSPTDTDETLRQIHEHNAVWMELCGSASGH